MELGSGVIISMGTKTLVGPDQATFTGKGGPAGLLGVVGV